MFGDSFFTVSLGPHRIGDRKEVFVPMFGDSFFTIASMVKSYQDRTERVFVPMFGDSFFTAGPGCPTGWALYSPFAAGIPN